MHQRSGFVLLLLPQTQPLLGPHPTSLFEWVGVFWGFGGVGGVWGGLEGFEWVGGVWGGLSGLGVWGGGGGFGGVWRGWGCLGGFEWVSLIGVLGG